MNEILILILGILAGVFCQKKLTKRAVEKTYVEGVAEIKDEHASAAARTVNDSRERLRKRANSR
jgi:hypothetical protein